MDSQIQHDHTIEVFNDEHKIVHNNQFNEIKKTIAIPPLMEASLKRLRVMLIIKLMALYIKKSRQKKQLEEIGSELHLKSGQKK